MHLSNKNNSFTGGNYSKEKICKANLSLCQDFFVDSNKCTKHEYYETYLKQTAYRDMEDGLGITYLYIDNDLHTGAKKIMGYITLRFSSLIKDMGDKKKYGYPALEISELAVSKSYSSSGVGTDMVMDAINMAEEINNQISIKYIVLCADPDAVGFYTRSILGFKRIDIHFGDDIPREHCNIDCVPLYLKLR